VHAGGVKDESHDLSLGALGRDVVAVPEEIDSGGVADSDDDLARGAERSVGRGDEGFLTYGLTVGDDRDPGSLRGTDHERKRRGGFGGRWSIARNWGWREWVVVGGENIRGGIRGGTGSVGMSL